MYYSESQSQNQIYIDSHFDRLIFIIQQGEKLLIFSFSNLLKTLFERLVGRMKKKKKPNNYNFYNVD